MQLLNLHTLLFGLTPFGWCIHIYLYIFMGYHFLFTPNFFSGRHLGCITVEDREYINFNTSDLNILDYNLKTCRRTYQPINNTVQQVGVILCEYNTVARNCYNIKFANVLKSQVIYNSKNIKEKLLKTNAPFSYNKIKNSNSYVETTAAHIIEVSLKMVY